MHMTVGRDGSIYFQTGEVRVSDIPQKIREQVSRGAKPTVYFHADARARYGAVADALDATRSAGIEHVAFITDQRIPPPAMQPSPLLP